MTKKFNMTEKDINPKLVYDPPKEDYLKFEQMREML